MKAWLTAQEIAELRLSGLPKTKRRVNALADRHDWSEDPERCRERAGRGGGLEYHVSLLPLPARIDLYRREITVDGLDEAAERAVAAEPAAGTLSAAAAEQRDARLALLSAAEKLRQATPGLSIIASDAAFARAYNAGRVEAPDWVRASIARISARSLARWRAARRLGTTSRLGVDRGKARKGKGLLDVAEGGEVRTHILALIIHQPHLTADHVRTLVRARWGDRLTVTDPATGETRAHDVPPIRTFQHHLKALKASHKTDLVALTDPDAFRSRHRIAGRGSLRHITRPGQLWQIDASPADVLLNDGRHSIYAASDIATRRTIIYATRTPRASGVAMLIRRAVLAWGVPEAIKTDNGSDFTARATERLFAALDIEAIVSPAYTPEDKAHVERVIRTFQHDLSPLLPGFIGHNVTDRKKIEARRSFAERLGTDDRDTFSVELGLDEFQAYCDAWSEDRYQHRPHDGLKGATPFEAASGHRETIRTVEPRALDMLIAPVAGGDGYRTVTKFGVRVDGNHYLAPWAEQGARVFVRMDPADLGRAYLFAEAEGSYLGEALCPALAGVDPAEALKAARAEQKEIIAARTAQARAEARRIAKGPALAELVLGQAKRDSAALISFPKMQTAHSTPAIEAAGDAARAADSREAPEPRHDADAIAMQARLAAGRMRREEPKSEQQLTHERWQRAVAIEAALEAGEPVCEADLKWHRGYSAGSEYHALDVAYRGAEWRGRSRSA